MKIKALAESGDFLFHSRRLFRCVRADAVFPLRCINKPKTKTVVAVCVHRTTQCCTARFCPCVCIVPFEWVSERALDILHRWEPSRSLLTCFYRRSDYPLRSLVFPLGKTAVAVIACVFVCLGHSSSLSAPNVSVCLPLLSFICRYNRVITKR